MFLLHCDDFTALQVVAAVNLQLQQLVLKAQSVAASGDAAAASQLTALRVSISKLAAVQQQDMVASIATLATDLATNFANNPSYDPSAELTVFQNVS